MMSADSNRRLAIKVRAIATIAESLADDLERGKLWEGEASGRLSAIQQELREAMNVNPDQHAR